MSFTFRGGIHPLRDMHEGKGASKGQAIRPLVPASVTIPMDMHIGAPSLPVVKKGDRVKLGQMIGSAQGGIGIPVHASVSGEVTFVGTKQMLGKLPSVCVTIVSDGLDEWTELKPLGGVETAQADRITQTVRDAGVCGLGGACFPTHVKMSPPQGKTVDTVILNGAECEMFLTADHRLMLEEPGRIVDGLRAIMRAMNVSRGIIAVEDNKPDAFATMAQAAQGREGVSVVKVRAKYPQGGEKQLIQAVLKREVPSGGLPMDARVAVFNVGTAAAVADAVTLGSPVVSRVTTVTGAVAQPCNLLARIGTSLQDAIEAAGGFAGTPGKIFVGGSMTGIAVPNTSVSIGKANNGVVVMAQKDSALFEPTPCIRCARCVRACPVYINPQKLFEQFTAQDFAKMKENSVMDCIVCGSCSYVCPAKLPLAPSFKEAKDKITTRRI